MSKRMLIVIFCTILVVLAILMMVVALGFEGKVINTSMPGSRFFPMLTLTLIICFSAGLIIKGLFIEKQGSDENQEKLDLSKSEILRVVLVTVSAFIAYALWNWVGFLPVAGFIILVIGLILKVRSVWSYLGLAAIAVAMFFIMTTLGIPLG